MKDENSQAARLPEHVAIIMDGNGRWASGRGLPRAAGHRAGAKTTRAIVETARDIGIKTLTLFAFSSENWSRPRTEVRLLMNLFRRTIRREVADLSANGVRMHFIGQRERFSDSLLHEMESAEQRTAHNTALDLVVAIDYGGRWDVVRAAQQVAAACAEGQLEAEAIDEQMLSEHLSLGRFANPDLFIRTGGEQRISNFLLWDIAYAELYFSDALWPDFGDAKLREAVAWYGGRDRRFGGLNSSAGSV